MVQGEALSWTLIFACSSYSDWCPLSVFNPA